MQPILAGLKRSSINFGLNSRTFSVEEEESGFLCAPHGSETNLGGLYVG